VGTIQRVLITGAGGFIGKPTIEAALKRADWEIHAVVSGMHPYSLSNECCVHVADLSNAEQCASLINNVKPDILIHLAWSVGDNRTECSVQNLIWVENSLRLLRLFFGCGGRRFVFAGSRTEYGEPKRQAEKRDAPPARCIYGESKHAFEQVCENFCAQKGYSFVSARIFTVYGEKEQRRYPLIPAAIDAFNRGQSFLCREPDTVWDFIHVEDVANALVQIAASDYCGIVNVGTGKPHLLRNVCTEIADKMGRPELLSFVENGDASVLVADPTVLREKIGYQCQVDFSKGIDRTIAWWRSQEFCLDGR